MRTPVGVAVGRRECERAIHEQIDYATPKFAIRAVPLAGWRAAKEPQGIVVAAAAAKGDQLIWFHFFVSVGSFGCCPAPSRSAIT